MECALPLDGILRSFSQKLLYRGCVNRNIAKDIQYFWVILEAHIYEDKQGQTPPPHRSPAHLIA